MRLFVAISPGAPVIRRIEQALGDLRRQAPSAKWVKEDSLHLTLAFLGERDAADVPAITEALTRSAAGHAPFDLRFRGGGSFGRPSRPRVLWIGCEGGVAALEALQASVSEALVPRGYVPEERKWNAHLTLARSREQAGDLGLSGCVEALQSADFGEARIDEITLYESRLSRGGAEYSPVHRALLAAIKP